MHEVKINLDLFWRVLGRGCEVDGVIDHLCGLLL